MVTMEKLREIVDSLQLSNRIDGDGDMNVVFGPSEEFAHNVQVWFTLESGVRLTVVAAARDFKLEGNLLQLANLYNNRFIAPTAVVRNGELIFEYSFMLNEEVSDEFLREDIVLFILSAISSAYKNILSCK